MGRLISKRGGASTSAKTREEQGGDKYVIPEGVPEQQKQPVESVNRILILIPGQP